MIKKWVLQLGPPSRSWSRPLTNGLRKRRSILKGSLLSSLPCSQTQEQLYLILWVCGALSYWGSGPSCHRQVSLSLSKGRKALALAAPRVKGSVLKSQSSSSFPMGRWPEIWQSVHTCSRKVATQLPVYTVTNRRQKLVEACTGRGLPNLKQTAKTQLLLRTAVKPDYS